MWADDYGQQVSGCGGAGLLRQTGQDVRYTDLPVDRYTELLVEVGLPEPYAAALADADRGLARGALFVPVEDLEKLIGRRPTSLADAVRAAL